MPGRRIPIISSTTFWDNVPAIDIQWVQNLWIPSGGGRRYPCRLPFSLFRRELDQCFGSVWTGSDVARRHCSHLWTSPPVPLLPQLQSHVGDLSKLSSIVVLTTVCSLFAPSQSLTAKYSCLPLWVWPQPQDEQKPDQCFFFFFFSDRASIWHHYALKILAASASSQIAIFPPCPSFAYPSME